MRRFTNPGSEFRFVQFLYTLYSVCYYFSLSVEKSPGEKSKEVAKESEKAANKSETPVKRGSASRKAIHHKYSKLEAGPVRRSSISATRKSDKGARRLFVRKPKPEEKKETRKETGTKIVVSPEAPPKPPRAQQVEQPKVVEDIPVVEESNKGIEKLILVLNAFYFIYGSVFFVPRAIYRLLLLNK